MLLSYESFLYILDVCQIDMWFRNIFPSLWLVLLVLSFKKQTILILMKSSLSIFVCIVHSMLYLRTLKSHEDFLWFLKIFMVYIFGLWKLQVDFYK